VGLGMPFIEGWTKREPVWNRLAGVAGAAVLAGILLPLILLLDSALTPLLEKASNTPAPTTVVHPPAWQGFLAAFSAGITEETLFRLFGLILVVWLGSLVFRSRTGRPAPGLLWAANILFALAFGPVHLRTASQLGITLTPLLVIRTLVINGAGGLLFGWLYVTFGLESAILAHIAADVVVHGFVPLVTQQADPARTIVATVVVLLLTLLAIVWSVRAILRDCRQLQTAVEPGESQIEVRFSHPAG